MIHYKLAEKEDIETIAHLLKINGLPFSDLQESAIDFIVAKNNDNIVGCIGLERCGTEGLLRSFAVEEGFRNLGIGNDLYNRVLNHASQLNIHIMHLLTNTAKDYFSKKGFRVADRSNAPEEIRKCREFASLCPASSTYMVNEVNSHYVS